MEYSYSISVYNDVDGVPFRTHAYVPEVHPDTGMIFCEREDEGHVLKVHTCTPSAAVKSLHECCFVYCNSV